MMMLSAVNRNPILFMIPLYCGNGTTKNIFEVVVFLSDTEDMISEANSSAFALALINNISKNLQANFWTSFPKIIGKKT